MAGKKVRAQLQEDGVGSDYAQATTRRDGRVVGYSESFRHGYGASGDVRGGGIVVQLAGRSPQNEEDTERVVRTLIRVLNDQGSRWGEPEVGDGDADMVCFDQDGNELRVQVVRALRDEAYWRDANTKGRGYIELTVQEAAKALMDSIASKSSHPSLAKGLVLALNADSCPSLVFDDVVDAFRDAYSEQARSAGFQAIWLVGPSPNLTIQLI